PSPTEDASPRPSPSASARSHPSPTANSQGLPSKTEGACSRPSRKASARRRRSHPPGDRSAAMGDRSHQSHPSAREDFRPRPSGDRRSLRLASPAAAHRSRQPPQANRRDRLSTTEDRSSQNRARPQQAEAALWRRADRSSQSRSQRQEMSAPPAQAEVQDA